jgi:Domain of unknown function (DUF4371)/hAT family C-terminal dimerisation region
MKADACKIQVRNAFPDEDDHLTHINDQRTSNDVNAEHVREPAEPAVNYVNAEHVREPAEPAVNYVNAEHVREPAKPAVNDVNAEHVREPAEPAVNYVNAEHVREPAEPAVNYVNANEQLHCTTNSGLSIDVFDPATHAGKVVSCEIRRKLTEHGPIQPESINMMGGSFPISKIGQKERSFSEHHYLKKMPDGSMVKREWLSYSKSTDKVFCISCMLHGTPVAQRRPLCQKGVNDWGHIHTRLLQHEATDEHIHAEIAKGMFLASFRIDRDLLGAANTRVAEHREVVSIIMSVIIYLATHNDALRGHDEKSTSFNRGRFLDLLSLVARNHPYLHSHLRHVNSNTKKNRVTFMSNVSQNMMIDVLANEVRSRILKDIKEAGLFAVIIDTTTDLAKLDQFSLLARYCNSSGEPQERLIALDVAEDATGAGMFKLFKELCQRHGLDWKSDLCAQSYDGAANMQGEYKGLRSLIQTENPRALYVWCFAHILNLVIVDAVDKNEESRNFFGVLQRLVSYMGARKRTAVHVAQQKILYPGQRCRRLKHLSNTRWTSHDRAIDAVMSTFESLLDSLDILRKDKDRETSSGADNFFSNLTSFKFVLMMLIMKSIFDITTPLSTYLQTKGLDFLQAMALVSSTTKELQDLRNEACFDKLYKQAVDFATRHGFNDCELALSETRVRRKKKMPGEMVSDEVPKESKTRYRTQVYYQVVDTCLAAIKNRFEQAEDILRDLAILNPDRLFQFQKLKDIPDDAFGKIVKWLPEINCEALKNEYIMFAKSYKNLIAAVKPNIIHLRSTMEVEEQKENPAEELKSMEEENILKTGSINFGKTDESDTDVESEVDSTNDMESMKKVSDILKIIKDFKIESAFPNLCLAYKGICTIPPSSASAERSFSKLKIIKTRLR